MRFIIPILLLLAACASPRERCEQDASAPYRAALAERADIAKTLARGYDLRTDFEQRRVFTRCRRSEHVVVPCWQTETVPVTRRVAIDAAALKARDTALARALPRLEREARAAIATCRALVPES